LVTTTRALFYALLLGLLATACGDAGDPAADPDATVDIDDSPGDAGGQTDEGGGAPDVPAPQPDTDEPQPDVDGPGPGDPDIDPGPSWPNVVVNEVAANGAPADWVELLNRTGETVDLTGWTVTDNDPEHVHAFEDGHTLGAGAYLLLLSGEAGGFTFGLGGSDAVNLHAPDGSLVDSTLWEGGQSATDLSWGRIPNGSGDFMTLETPTPGGANAPNTPQDCGNGSLELGEVCDGAMLEDKTCQKYDFASGLLACSPACDAFDFSGCIAPSRIIVINEATSTDDDRIELFNAGFAPVVIAGWSVTDEKGEPSAGIYTLPGGAVLGPGEYRVLTKDLDHLFGLGGKDEVRLWDGDGVLIDRLAWPKDEAAVSYCLVPNGGDTAQPCEAQSFGGAND